MLTRGWGPFVEMKFNILVDSVESGRLSVDVSLRLATSTFIMVDASGMISDIEGECGCILHISCIIKDPGINGGCTDTYDGYILDACSGYQ